MPKSAIGAKPGEGAPVTSTRQLLPREQRQASLLRAAAQAFARAGYAATSMDDVAAEAGVSRLIVYRHFASKEELYRSVLDRIAQRLHDEFVAGVAGADGSEPDGFTTRLLLHVARDEPDGFRLLVVHAAREPQFASYTASLREAAVAIADELIGDTIPDRSMRAWATHTIVDYLYASVLAWLDYGDAERDEQFIEWATAGLVALYRSWVDPSL
jgi:AcrR family transcriptional regulator